MKTMQIKNSKISEISETSEILFRVFDFGLQTKKKFGKKFPIFPRFPSFRPGPDMKMLKAKTLILMVHIWYPYALMPTHPHLNVITRYLFTGISTLQADSKM